MSEVTPIRGGGPSLMDIPGRLRYQAERYESGKDPMPSTFVWVEYDPEGEVSVGAFGFAPQNKAQVVGILALAQRIFNHKPGDLQRGGDDVGELAPVIQLRGTPMIKIDDPNEGGVSQSAPGAVPPAERKTSKAWIGYVVAGLIAATLIFLAVR